MTAPDLGLHRSYLYVVAHQERHVAKAYASEVDAVVLELEDAVAPSMKAAARDAAAELLRDPPPKPTYVRVNPLGTGLTFDDVVAVAGADIEGIRIAKAESPEDVHAVGRWLDELGSSLRIQVLLETAAAVEDVSRIVRGHDRVVGAALGEQDLAADLGVVEEGLLYARSKVVLTCRAAGLAPPWQSVWTDIPDLDGLEETSRVGRRLGFFGRSAIHPSQVEVINAVFTPTADELAAAEDLQRQLDDAVDAGSAGLKTPDGRFIDNAVVQAAARTIAFGRRSGAP